MGTACFDAASTPLVRNGRPVDPPMPISSRLCPHIPRLVASMRIPRSQATNPLHVRRKRPMTDLPRPDPLFAIGDRVVREKNPDAIGEILAEAEWDLGDWWYKARFGRGTGQYPEFELIPEPEEGEKVEDLAMAGRWGAFEALRRAVAVERILRHNGSTVYAYNAQRIQFLPHQYKPLLKFLESDDRRLLIADEVGLGKTIEAGLILAEVKARQKADRVLVICPSRLREKWRDEMDRKFRQEFEIWDTASVRSFVERVRRNPRRSSFQAIASIQMLRRSDLLEELLSVIPGIDLLIFDEAHHARNPGTSTAAMVEQISNHSDAVLFLTATPLHLGAQDLFHLLRLLREGEFRDLAAFNAALKRNEGIVYAQHVVRFRAQDKLAKAAGRIRDCLGLDAFGTGRDPLAASVLSKMEKEPPSDPDQWLALERLLEQAHVLSHLFSRTKKRDAYENSPERKGGWFRVQWTPEEHRAYCVLAGFDPTQPLEGQSFGLGSIQRARQAASSVHGTLLYKRREHLIEGCSELSDIEDLSESIDEEGEIIHRVQLPPVDSKFDKLLEILELILKEDPTRKVLLFTFFTGTSMYLLERLNQLGIPTLRIAGDIPSNPRIPDKDERAKVIRQFQEDQGIQVLVSTEVGSEGLDFQFCSHLVNYDLPWNPMVVEQRIGRIDRYGQKAAALHFYSLVVEDTIEDRILKRLYDRIDIFQQSVGDLESILGEEMASLRSEFYSGRLTASELEKKVVETGHVIERRVRDVRELEERASDLVGHEDFIREEVRKVRRLGRYVTAVQVRSVLSGFFEINHPDLALQDVEEGIFRVKLSSQLMRDIEDASEPEEQWSVELRMKSRNGYLLLTTDGEKAFNDDRLDLLNAGHPLVKTAARSLEGLMEKPVARVGSLLVRAEEIGKGLNPGLYYLAVFVVVVRRGSDPDSPSRRYLEAVVCGPEDLLCFQGDDAERFLHVCLERGEEHPQREDCAALPDTAWRALISAARRRKVGRKQREELENQSLYERRRQRCFDERDRKLASAKKRLQTSMEAGREERIINLNRAQIEAVERVHSKNILGLESGLQLEVELQAQPTVICAVEVR